MQLFKATNKESNHLVVVWACYCLARAQPGSEDCMGMGCLYAVFVLKRQTMYVCVAPRPSERSRWVKSIFVLGSYTSGESETLDGEKLWSHIYRVSGRQ